MSHQIGLGQKSVERFFSFMGIVSLKKQMYKSSKAIVGKSLIWCAEETIHNAQEVENKAAVEKDPACSVVSSLGQRLVELIISIDMGWNKCSSGHRYNGPSGVLYMLGVISNKILLAAVMVRICLGCNKLKETKEELVVHFQENKDHKATTCNLPNCNLCVHKVTLQ